MRSTIPLSVAISVIGLVIATLPSPMFSAELGEVRSRADQSFDRLSPHPDRLSGSVNSGEGFSLDHYWVGYGQGEMSKGKSVCRRVAELSARTDLAKQIRVLVKEHLVDRVRERSGRESDQDIELTREELVQEYLQGVRIVDYRIDEEQHTCTATAVMPKSQVQLKSGAGTSGSLPEATR